MQVAGPSPVKIDNCMVSLGNLQVVVGSRSGEGERGGERVRGWRAHNEKDI